MICAAYCRDEYVIYAVELCTGSAFEQWTKAGAAQVSAGGDKIFAILGANGCTVWTVKGVGSEKWINQPYPSQARSTVELKLKFSGERHVSKKIAKQHCFARLIRG